MHSGAGEGEKRDAEAQNGPPTKKAVPFDKLRVRLLASTSYQIRLITFYLAFSRVERTSFCYVLFRAVARKST